MGHNYEVVVTNPTCTAEGYTTHTCSRCADAFTDGTTAPIGHDESDWIVDQDSAPGVEGSKHTECTVCGVMMETSVIEALPEETESESQQDTEEISDTDTDMETVTDTDEESTTAQGTEKAPSGGGCFGSVQGISILLLFIFAAMIPVFKRKKEDG